MQPAKSMPDITTLVRLFFENPEELGQISPADPAILPPLASKLLDHHEHMTETVEAHHGCPVDVEVLETAITDTHYSRMILLRRQTDRQVVQFGIVRLNFEYLGEDVRSEIEAQNTPLGRVLINHNVLRQVEMVDLWRVEPAARLATWLGSDQTTYGRTALIHCNGEPAVELLEIVVRG